MTYVNLPVRPSVSACNKLYVSRGVRTTLSTLKLFQTADRAESWNRYRGPRDCQLRKEVERLAMRDEQDNLPHQWRVELPALCRAPELIRYDGFDNS